MNIKVTAFTVSEKSIDTWSEKHSMYVLFAVDGLVSWHNTMTGDSQISNPSIPSLTLYKLSHCAS